MPSVAETVVAREPANPDLVMLIRPRRSRIYYLRKFFDYPITLTANDYRRTSARCAWPASAPATSASRVHQIQPEKSLEDFLINRFGRELYLTFFKSYTEKVWGTPCHEISAEWGAQRIKGLSLTTARQALPQESLHTRKPKAAAGDIAQKGNRHLAHRALHVSQVRPRPALGARRRPHRRQKGGEIHMRLEGRQAQLRARPRRDSPRHLARSRQCHRRAPHLRRRLLLLHHAHARTARALMDTPIPANVLEVSDGLQYRDFITVGLLADKLEVEGARPAACSRTPGSTSRSPTSSSAACRSSTTGAPTWSATPPRSGSASNTSATTPTICGRCPTTT